MHGQNASTTPSISPPSTLLRKLRPRPYGITYKEQPARAGRRSGSTSATLKDRVQYTSKPAFTTATTEVSTASSRPATSTNDPVHPEASLSLSDMDLDSSYADVEYAEVQHAGVSSDGVSRGTQSQGKFTLPAPSAPLGHQQQTPPSPTKQGRACGRDTSLGTRDSKGNGTLSLARRFVQIQIARSSANQSNGTVRPRISLKSNAPPVASTSRKVRDILRQEWKDPNPTPPKRYQPLLPDVISPIAKRDVLKRKADELKEREQDLLQRESKVKRTERTVRHREDELALVEDSLEQQQQALNEREVALVAEVDSFNSAAAAFTKERNDFLRASMEQQKEAHRFERNKEEFQKSMEEREQELRESQAQMDGCSQYIREMNHNLNRVVRALVTAANDVLNVLEAYDLNHQEEDQSPPA